jgi:nickel transport protein
MRGIGVLLPVWLMGAAAHAHQVVSTIGSAPATVATLTYADGKPFAYEAYELFAGGAETPRQVGRTDALGRVTFLPDGQQAWRLRAFTEDGHGIDTAFEVAPHPVSAATTSPRLPLALLGGSLVLALFGLYQLFLRRRG